MTVAIDGGVLSPMGIVYAINIAYSSKYIQISSFFPFFVPSSPCPHKFSHVSNDIFHVLIDTIYEVIGRSMKTYRGLSNSLLKKTKYIIKHEVGGLGWRVVFSYLGYLLGFIQARQVLL